MNTMKGILVGMAPILFNRWADPAADLDAPSTKAKSSKQRLEDAKLRVYRNGSGLYLPSWNLKRCIMEGCNAAGLKAKGNKSLSRLLQPVLFVEGELLFGVDEPDFIHEVPGRQPPGPRGKGCIVRRPALKEGWRLPFTLKLMDAARHPDEVKLSLETAGLYVGLGGWRPEYGRFTVTEWTVEEDS